MTDLDWSTLDTAVNPHRNCFRYEDVSHLFKKVAFDVYKPLSGSDQLWELRQAEDGKQYLYALYEDPEDITVESEQEEGPWRATSDHSGENVTLSYKNIPIARYAGVKEGFKPNEAGLFAEFLESKAQEKDFLEGLIRKLPDAKKEVLAGLLTIDQHAQ